jgi:hypothetical protein
MAQKLQIGVVPILINKKRRLIVLISARDNDRWLPPKGNQDRKYSNRDMALTEAYEEAGVTGRIRHKDYVDVPFRKDGRIITLRLYPMVVERVLKRWPEQKSRKRTICDPRKARKLLGCKKLCAGMDRLLAGAA